MGPSARGHRGPGRPGDLVDRCPTSAGPPPRSRSCRAEYASPVSPRGCSAAARPPPRSRRPRPGRRSQRLLQLHQHERRGGHEDAHVDVVGRPETRAPPQLTSHHSHLRAPSGRPGKLVIASWLRPALGRSHDHRRRPAQVAGALDGGDDEAGAVGLMAAVEEAERLNDPAGGGVVLRVIGLPWKYAAGLRAACRRSATWRKASASPVRVEVALGSHWRPRKAVKQRAAATSRARRPLGTARAAAEPKRRPRRSLKAR